jgi:hypothetical protein
MAPQANQPLPDDDAMNELRGIYGSAGALLREDGRLDPMCFFRRLRHLTDGEDGEGWGILDVRCNLAGVDFNEDKKLVGRIIRTIARDTKASCVIFLCEAWYSAEAAVDFIATGDTIPPSLQPDRKEGVIFSVSMPGHRCWMLGVSITRDENNKPSIPEEFPTERLCMLPPGMHGTFMHLCDMLPGDDLEIKFSSIPADQLPKEGDDE